MVKSVDKALRIITLISERKDGIGVTELAAHIEMTKSSVFKLVRTLVNHGFIEQDTETKRYRLGYKFIEMSSVLLDSIDLRSQAVPLLKELESLTNEVIHLVVYDEGEAFYIEKLEGNETLRTHSKVGKRVALHATSAGKVIMANLPETEAEKILEKHGLPRHTANTITDRETFFNELRKISRQGYGVEIEENEEDITCIAAPLFDHRGEIAAAVSISAPSIRMNRERLDALKPVIMKAGKKISQRLGYIGE